ncbi:response regulator transcription factor [Candidatus Sulfurimonas marisnigri]|uniref:Response regulator transcription factor n=1 Tax=Candidatus Sulfurimonas marisnigri TaxID=2740405 RepID=A0A7S7M1P7_9BACT|nr:LuxR C-terminal-related transcriptional regulator [Candidatus Sulfurimonas marisnigri]QOY55310.1 response regulator transcription factor [Candidatus Sulfurimonas marisnigri]
MTINQIELLEKVIFIQSCVIEGRDIKAVLRKETSIFKKKSGAEVIAFCLENGKYVNIELVLEESKKFLSLIRKYKLRSKDMILNKFIEQCSLKFGSSREYIKIESIYEIFESTLSKSKSYEFEKEMNFKEARIFPLRNRIGKKVGFVIYFFCNDSIMIYENLPDVTKAFETLIRPFYDSKVRTLHSKCIQADKQMDLLTEREKQIAYRVLQGKTHKTVAYELEISINTFKTHMKNIYNKYGVSSKIELSNKLKGNVIRSTDI